MSLHRLVLFSVGTFLFAACGHEQEGLTPAPSADKANIDPNAVCSAQAARVVTLFGEGLSPLPTKVLEDSPELILPTLELSQVESINGQVSTADPLILPDDPQNVGESRIRWIGQGELRFTLDDALGLSPGLYSIRVTNGNENTALWE
ncbi:MAG: hypothetical protein JRH20_32225, partial [Deltaproteobacteria bacterium]|nr:hypothetical protein [Deltaproteobacteria bacterium]